MNIFDRLQVAGYERLDLGDDEDLLIWRRRQRAIADAAVQVAAPDPNLLPEGWRWCEAHETGKPVRWVPVLAADGGE